MIYTTSCMTRRFSRLRGIGYGAKECPNRWNRRQSTSFARFLRWEAASRAAGRSQSPPVCSSASAGEDDSQVVGQGPIIGYPDCCRPGCAGLVEAGARDRDYPPGRDNAGLTTHACCGHRPTRIRKTCKSERLVGRCNCSKGSNTLLLSNMKLSEASRYVGIRVGMGSLFRG